jgi:tetratricopeptide (TPR) repeat protein
MKCIICNSSDLHSEKNLHSTSELMFCRACGAAMHNIDNRKENDLLDYYRKDYRNKPNHMNLITTQNKQNYISHFLREFLSSAKEQKKRLKCVDIGAATGYLPAFLRQLTHNATGTEYGLGFRRFSQNFYGISLSEEINKNEKYDLISIYHVLEHMQNPVQKIKQYRELLNEDGKMLISTPCWFGVIDLPSPNSDFDDYFHKDHINLFSKASLKNLFKLCGLKIEKEDSFVYGQTYLLSRREPSNDIDTEDWQIQSDKTKKIKSALDLLASNKPKEAIEEYFEFPSAHIQLIMGSFSKERERQKESFEDLQKNHSSLFGNRAIQNAYSTWLFQGQEYQKAIEAFNELLKKTPDSNILMNLGLAYYLSGKKYEALGCFLEVSRQNPTRWAEAMNWVCQSASEIELPEEVAQKAVFENAQAIHSQKNIYRQ